MAEDDRRRELSFSSEYPVQRWFGREILDHGAGSVRMKFLQSGRAPYLLQHDQSRVIGVIEKAWLDQEKKNGRAVVRFSRSQQASDTLRDIDDSIMVNVSCGYQIHEMILEKSEDTEDTYRITDWEPLEASSVGIPADPTVGVGRAQAAEPLECRDVRPPTSVTSVSTTTAQAERGITMSDTGTAAAGQKAPSATEHERERIAAIEALGKANRIDPRTVRGWIEEGVPLMAPHGEKSVSNEILAVVEERGKQKPMEATTLGLNSRETQRYSLFRAIRALKYGHANRRIMDEAAFELECSAQVARQLKRELTSSILIPAEVLQRPLGEGAQQSRAMATQPGSKGGFMVGVQNMGFIDILRNRSVAMNMGARVLSGLQGNITFPRQTGKVTVTWQGGDGASITAADQTLGQLSMTPKTCIAITDVSEQLLAQASPSAEAFVMADLANDVAIDGVDNAVINGTGGAQPLGIKNTTGITSGQDASSATYAKVLAFPSTAGGLNAIRGNPGWVTNTAGAARLMQVARFANTDTPVWEGNMMDGTLVGFRSMSSEQLASGNIIFGSWDEIIIGEWGVLELSMDAGGTRFNTAQVGIRAMWMVDVLLRYPQCFVVGTNLS
ncbi:MAG TPA: phage major capsid protein [Aquabacterium sp.]|nr:phage major capsid protein [Aquabacterium sp.]